MTPAKNAKADIEARAALFAFPAPDDWKNIVHDLKLTKAQENDLEITIRHVLADIEKYQARPSRNNLVPALKRLEKALGPVQDEMARSKDLMRYFLPSNTLEFIGESFTFTAIGQAVAEEVFPIHLDHEIQDMIEKNNSITMAGLEKYSRGDRVALGYKHGADILKYFLDVIHADLKSWVELDKRNPGGRPADIYRQYIIQRLAARSTWIIGKEAATTAGGKFENLCVAVLPACGFTSTGIEKAIAAVLGKMKGKKDTERVMRKATSK
jgi:hypothetical protein